MKNPRYVILVVVIVALAVTAVVVYFSMTQFDTTLEFQIQDIVSKNWVWDARIALQNRTIRSFYQSDRGPRTFRFTHLEPGRAILEISAPGYEPISLPVNLEKGENRLEEPINLLGLELPDLSHFIIFEELVGKDVICEIRPVSLDGPAVLNHPCMDLWVGARVSVQMKDSLIVQNPTDVGSERGEELFVGQIEWTWDALPETVFRYSARIPGAKIKEHEAPYRVIDYLLIVPHPGNTTKREVESMAQEAWEKVDPALLAEQLEKYSSKFNFYIHTSWNVEAQE